MFTSARFASSILTATSRTSEALQQQRQPAIPRLICALRTTVSAAEPGHDGVPRPVRPARPEQQSDPVSAGKRQHLRHDAVPERSTAPPPRTTTAGASLQATEHRAGVRARQSFRVRWQYRSQHHAPSPRDSTLGFVNPDLTVTVDPHRSEHGAIIHTLGDIGYGPRQRQRRTTPIMGSYALDTFDVTERLSATAGARAQHSSDLTVTRPPRQQPGPQQHSDLHPSQPRLPA